MSDLAEGLAPLSPPQTFVQASQGLRGGMTLRVYIIRFPQKVLRAWTYEMPEESWSSIRSRRREEV